MYYLETIVNLKQDKDIVQLLEDITDAFAIPEHLGILSQSLLMITNFLNQEMMQISVTVDNSKMSIGLSKIQDQEKLQMLQQDAILNRLIDKIQIENGHCRLYYQIHIRQNRLSQDRQIVFEKHLQEKLVKKYGLVEINKTCTQYD